MPGRALLLALLACALPAAGCGSNGEKHDPFGSGRAGGATGAQANAQARADGVAARLRAAGRARSCANVRALLHPVYGRVGDDACRATKDLITGLRSARAEAYGTAVVVDFRAGKHRTRRSAVFAPARGGGERLVFVEDVPESTVGTLFVPDFDKAAKAALKLISGGDCRALAAVAHASVGPALDQQRTCDALPRSPLVKALKAEPKLKPRRLGGNSYFAFYGLEPRRGPAFTLIFAQQDPAEVPGAGAGQVARYAFVDALPAG